MQIKFAILTTFASLVNISFAKPLPPDIVNDIGHPGYYTTTPIPPHLAYCLTSLSPNYGPSSSEEESGIQASPDDLISLNLDQRAVLETFLKKLCKQ